MKFLKIFIEFKPKNEGNNFEDTSWQVGGLVLKISEVINYLDEIGCETEEFPLDKVWDLCVHKDKPNYINSPRVQNANLEYPIIIAKENGKYYVIDGHHRIMKARGLNLKTIKARVFDLKKSPKKFQKIFSSKI